MNTESGTALCVERTGRSFMLGKGSLQMLRSEFQIPSQESPRWRVQSREPEPQSTVLPPAQTRDAGRQTPDFHLVGRDAELAQLHKGFNTALSGERQVIFVSGEAGIGKTTLIDAFLAQIRDHADVRITSGQCVEQYGPGEAYLPLLEATTRLCRGPGGERRLTALQRYAPSWLAQLPSLLEPREFNRLQQRLQGTSHERMLREMAETAEGFAATRIVVLVLEDLHWGDVSTLDWITYMARRRGPAKLLILGAYRPTDALTNNHPLCGVVRELQARRQGKELRLTPLAEEAIAEYLAARLNVDKEGQRAVPRQFIPLLHQRTGGNPLFLVNMVDDLLRQEVFVADGGQKTRCADAVKAISESLPDTVRKLIERQFERLPQSEQRLLEAASVAGVEFAAAEVATGLRTTEEGHIEATCERLARTGQWLRAIGVAEWPDGTISGRYSFLHAVPHEVVYAQLAEVQRVQLHRRIAARKETAYGERTREIAAELAMHFERGREYAKAEHYRQQAEENQKVKQAEGVRPQAEEPLPFSPSSLSQALSSPTGSTQHPAPNTHVSSPHSPLTTPHLSFPAPSLFRCEGEYWTLSFADVTCRLKDARGLHYIAHLLQHLHQEYHVLTLASAGASLSQETAETQSLRDLSLSFDHSEGLSDAGEIFDPQARTTYQQRLRELRKELAEAQAFHDLGRSEHLTAEVDILTHELTRAVGLDGQGWREVASTERARVNITRAIKIALRKITEHHPALGQHLAHTIKTGVYCSYTPDPRLPITWQV
jgi:hypothetical protein